MLTAVFWHIYIFQSTTICVRNSVAYTYLNHFFKCFQKKNKICFFAVIVSVILFYYVQNSHRNRKVKSVYVFSFYLGLNNSECIRNKNINKLT